MIYIYPRLDSRIGPKFSIGWSWLSQTAAFILFYLWLTAFIGSVFCNMSDLPILETEEESLTYFLKPFYSNIKTTFG